MATALYPNLVRLHDSGVLSDVELEHVVAATAEGYAFPTNLDRDPSVDGIAPRSQAEILRQALRDGLGLRSLPRCWRRARSGEKPEGR